MIFRNLDANGDWTFGQGLDNYATKNNAIGLNIKTRILSWVGDCFFDIGAGIDWLNRLGFKNRRLLLESDLRTIILKSFGIVGLIKFNTELNGRNFVANYSVNSTFTSIQDSVGVPF